MFIPSQPRVTFLSFGATIDRLPGLETWVVLMICLPHQQILTIMFQSHLRCVLPFSALQVIHYLAPHAYLEVILFPHFILSPHCWLSYRHIQLSWPLATPAWNIRRVLSLSLLGRMSKLFTSQDVKKPVTSGPPITPAPLPCLPPVYTPTAKITAISQCWMTFSSLHVFLPYALTSICLP